MEKFSARISKLGINPYVTPPAAVLRILFSQAEKNKGPIPVRGKLNGKGFQQTLVRYQGKWRLYLNSPMRKSSGTDVGDEVLVEIAYDKSERKTEMPPKLTAALKKNRSAMKIFSSLTPSRQKEIMRYIGNLKTAESIDRNVKKAIGFLTEDEKFIGRKRTK